VPSHHPDPTRDGTGNQICVDSTMSSATPPYNYTSHAFIEHAALQGGANGSIPATVAGFCKH
jgi:hypothetical protein